MLVALTKPQKNAFMSQQNLGLIIKSLETELGVELFVRNNKGIKLTTDGENFLSYAQQIVCLYDDYFQQRLIERQSDIINLYTTPSLGEIVLKLQNTFINEQLLLSIYKQSNTELQHTIKNKIPGIYLFPLYNGQPEYIAKLPNKHTIVQDDTCVTICHKSNPLLTSNEDFNEKLAKTIHITDSYEGLSASNTININNITACKTLMKEKGFVYSLPLSLYHIHFWENDWGDY